MAGQFSYKGSFSGWIREVMKQRLQPDADAMHEAALALLNSGVTTVYDHVGPWSDLSPILNLPLHYKFFIEVAGVTPETAEARLSMAQDLAIKLKREGYWAAPTPHSPYSLNADVFEAIVNSPSPQPSPKGEGGLSIHYAESAEEQEYFATGVGKMAEFLSELGACHPEAKPKDLIEILRAAMDDRRRAQDDRRGAQNDKGWLAIHCNTVNDEQIAMLISTNATVVHCPRSHRYFNHPPFPLEKLRAAGIPIAIGTDSLASCPNFDFLAELRAMREEFPFLSTEEILKMATQRDTLTPSDTDDMIGLPMQDDILKGPVTFSRIGGRRVI